MLVIDTMSGKRRDVAGVQAEFGVLPQQMVDYQCLVGDTVDNVPGVEQVGPKTAVKWLREYGSLEAIVAHAEQMPGAVGAKLRAALDWLPTARQLLRIKTDCDLSAHLSTPDVQQALRMQAPDRAALRDFYQRYGFKTLVRALEEGAAQREAGATPGGGAKRVDGAKPAGAGAASAAPAGEPDVAAYAGLGAAAGSAEAAEAAPPPAPPPRLYQTVLTWDCLLYTSPSPRD